MVSNAIMATVKTLALFMLVGAALGLLLISFTAPGFIKWDNTPSMGQALCDCAKCAGETASRLLVLQAEGGITGAVISLGLGIAWEVRRRKKQPAAAAPS